MGPRTGAGVDEFEAEEQRLRQGGVTITLPLQEDPWGERLFQVRDPNGIVIQLVEWAEGALKEKYLE